MYLFAGAGRAAGSRSPDRCCRPYACNTEKTAHSCSLPLQSPSANKIQFTLSKDALARTGTCSPEVMSVTQNCAALPSNATRALSVLNERKYDEEGTSKRRTGRTRRAPISKAGTSGRSAPLASAHASRGSPPCAPSLWPQKQQPRPCPSRPRSSPPRHPLMKRQGSGWAATPGRSVSARPGPRSC